VIFTPAGPLRVKDGTIMGRNRYSGRDSSGDSWADFERRQRKSARTSARVGRELVKFIRDVARLYERSRRVKANAVGRKFSELSPAEQQAALARGQYPGHRPPSTSPIRVKKVEHARMADLASAASVDHVARRKPHGPSKLQVFGEKGCAVVAVTAVAVLVVAVLLMLLLV